MISLLKNIVRALLESLRDLLPIIIVVAFFQFIVLQQPIPNLERILTGALLVLVGLTLFIKGLEMGLFPIGESIAYAFAKKGSPSLLLLFAFALGFGTTIAEPALIAVAAEAAKVAAAGGMIAETVEAQKSYAFGLRLTVAVAVGFAIIVGVVRIIRGWPIQYLIIAGYLGVVIMTAFAPKEIIGIARSEEHTPELQSRETNSYAVFCLKKTNGTTITKTSNTIKTPIRINSEQLETPDYGYDKIRRAIQISLTMLSIYVKISTMNLHHDFE